MKWISGPGLIRVVPNAVAQDRRGVVYLAWLVGAIVLVVGVVGSLKVVMAHFGLEADTSHSIMLWYGIEVHGLSWVRDWMFTQDNWLLSLVPFHFLGFFFVGPTPAVALLFGWLIFLCSAFVSGAIAWQLGSRKAAIVIALALLFLGRYAHHSGFVSYSTSHNITNLFGLGALYLVLIWVRAPSLPRLIAVLAILMAGSVSDPWMVAAYDLPLALVGVAALLLPSAGVGRADAFKLLLISLVSIVAVKTTLFGALGFLPVMEFHRGDWATISGNLDFLIRDLGGLLNISPLHQGNERVPAILSLIVILTLLTFCLSRAAKSVRTMTPAKAVFVVFASLSTGAIVLAFVISKVAAADHSARFLINAVYLILISLGFLIETNWPKSSIVEKSLGVLVAFLFVLSGIVSNLQSWRLPGFSFRDTGTGALIEFLKSNDLSYGYGPYWGSNANAVTAASRSEVVIRPVVFDKSEGTMIVGNRAESSRRWYVAEDYPPDQKSFFVFVVSDDEECADLKVCLNGLARQFGEPARTLSYQKATILVWTHPLVGR